MSLTTRSQNKELLKDMLLESGGSEKGAQHLAAILGEDGSEELILTDELLYLLPEHLVRLKKMIPLHYTDNVLTIAMRNPDDLTALDHIKIHATKQYGENVQLKAVAITEDDFYRVLSQHFSKSNDDDDDDDDEKETPYDGVDVDSILEEIDVEDIEEEDEEPEITDVNAVPVVRLANAILAIAVQKKASDIHIEPQPKGLKVRYRIDGILVEEMKLPKQMMRSLISRLKIMSSLNIAEKRLPQDGRLRQRVKRKIIDFRVSTLPSRYGEHIVMRILDSTSTQVNMDDLFIYPETLQTVKEMVNRPYGIIFVTGPTGSGKTTTLYSILADRNKPEIHITTAEDPIEYELPGITQVQAKPEIGLTFARILKAFLRQDPDIMLIGETRDKELAGIAIESALTGHLVFTSLHTNDAPGAITRLQEMGVHGFLIASATIGVIAQRLVRRLCPHCKIPHQPDNKLLDYVGYRYKPGESVIIYQADPNGCEQCVKGYKGRVAVYEIMTMNDQMRDLINRNADITLIRGAAKEAGMLTLKDYSLRLVGDGYTSLEEVMRVTMSEQGQDNLCPHCRSDIESGFVLCPFCEAQLRKMCHTCGTEIRKNWKVCPHCGVNSRTPQKPHTLPKTLSLDKEMAACPTCLSSIQTDWKKCPHCFTQFGESEMVA